MAVKKRGGQPGNQNARSHGFYAEHFKPGESVALDQLYPEGTRSAGEGGEALRPEIELLRVVMRRLFGLIDKEYQPASIAATPADTRTVPPIRTLPRSTSMFMLGLVTTSLLGLIRLGRQGTEAELADSLRAS